MPDTPRLRPIPTMEIGMSASTTPKMAAEGSSASIARQSRTRVRAGRARDARHPARDRLAATAERELVLAAKVGGEPERDELVEAFVPLGCAVVCQRRLKSG